MRRSVLLLAALAKAVLLASGVASAVTPTGTPGVSGREAPQDAQGQDAALDAALRRLVAMHGGPPGVFEALRRAEVKAVCAALANR